MNYLIYGTSYMLIDEEIKKIIADKSYKTIFLSEVNINDVLEDLRYNSMFDEEKILIIKNFELFFEKKDNETKYDLLNQYLVSPNSSTTIIFISSTKISDKAKKNKEILSHLNIITTPIINKSYELAKLLGEYINKSGYAISQNALNIFATKCASSVDIAFMELDKLKRIKGKNHLITEKDIEEFVSNYNTNDIFDFKDVVINKKLKEANNMINDLEASKAELVPLVVMLAKEYETLYNIKALASKSYTNDKIGETLDHMHPYRVKILREVNNKYTLDELKRLILYLCNLDLKLVSEDNLGFDELRKFLLEL